MKLEEFMNDFKEGEIIKIANKRFLVKGKPVISYYRIFRFPCDESRGNLSLIKQDGRECWLKLNNANYEVRKLGFLEKRKYGDILKLPKIYDLRHTKRKLKPLEMK